MKDGHAESYEGVTVDFAKKGAATIVVYDEGKEIDRILLPHMGTMKALHQAMVDAGFTLKPEPERKLLVAQASEREANLRAIHHKRSEYIRVRAMYLDLFRQHVMQQDIDEEEKRRPHYLYNDPLVRNFDRINQKEAILKAELLEKARSFLAATKS